MCEEFVFSAYHYCTVSCSISLPRLLSNFTKQHMLNKMQPHK